ncbi:MAG: hypothetical protein QME32_08175, partial [Endomicrobiia bacterium]|nr:hypothetical protein [Endomicrobiia bacterium]
HNDIADAFRHAYWNALMVRDIGDELVMEIANNHELNDNKPDQNIMDYINNKIGREIGERLKREGITDDEAYADEIFRNKNRLMDKPPKIDR